MRHVGALVVAMMCATGCSGSDGVADMAMPLDPLVAARPYGITLPKGHDSSKKWPLIVVLHGYGATGAVQDAYFGISAMADARGTVVATPDGTVDFTGKNFWNATNACCDFANTGVDDVAYLTALIKDTITRFSVDPNQVFIVGHSNGAFMAHRMACDRADMVSAIAAFAGEVWEDMSLCQPSTQIAVAQIHGDANTTIDYEGGQVLAGLTYPSTPMTYAFWKSKAGCTGEMVDPPRDLVDALPGAETLVSNGTGCQPGGAAELWEIHGADHVPIFNSNFSTSVYDFFAAHHR